MRGTRTSPGLIVRTAAIALGATIAAGIAAAPGVAPQEADAAAQAAGTTAGIRPNIVLVVTDDQRLDELRRRFMPATTRLIADRGTVFENAIVPTPTCCPSRATMLTGQYGHNNGVVANAPGYRSLEDPDNTLPVWLNRAGYQTAHLGKYLNGYQGAVEPDTEVPPGWRKWFTMLTPRRYYGYTLAVNGGQKEFGRHEPDHLTRVLNRETSKTIEQFARKPEPFYIQLDHFAPHTESGRSEGPSRCKGRSVPDPRDDDLFDTKLFEELEIPKGANFNENDVSDKPSFIRNRGKLKKNSKKKLLRRHRCRIASLRAVDRGMAKIVRTLRDQDILDRTVIIFVSDNGYFRGEHRIRLNKTVPYEEALRVPLAIRAPAELLGAEQPKRLGQPVANLDLAPTILALAGAEPCNGTRCRVMDGRSLVGLLRGSDPDFPNDRTLLIEYQRTHDNEGQLCEYAGIRTRAFSYVEYTGLIAGGVCAPIDEGEIYDLRFDRFQLVNLFDPGGGGTVQQALEGELDALRECTGIPGRDPEPAEGTYCE